MIPWAINMCCTSGTSSCEITQQEMKCRPSLFESWQAKVHSPVFLFQVFADVKAILDKEGWVSPAANNFHFTFFLFINCKYTIISLYVHPYDFLLLVTFCFCLFVFCFSFVNAALFVRECVCVQYVLVWMRSRDA